MVVVNRQVFQSAIARGCQQRLLRRVGLSLSQLSWRNQITQHAGLTIARASHDLLCGDGSILAHLVHDGIWVSLTHRIGGSIPILIANHHQLAARNIALHLVRASGNRSSAIILILALAVGNRGEGDEGSHPVELTERLVQVEDDGLVVRSFNGIELLAFKWAVVILSAFEQLLVVAQASREGVSEGALEAPLDVLRGDGLAVGELHTLLESKSPHFTVVTRLTGVGGEVRDELGVTILAHLPLVQATVDHAARRGGEVLAGSRIEVDARTSRQNGESAAFCRSCLSAGTGGSVCTAQAGC